MDIKDAIIHAKQVAEGCESGSACAYQHDKLADWLEELAALRQKEADGLLVNLPCKVGDALYVVDIDPMLRYTEVEVRWLTTLFCTEMEKF